MRFTRLPQPIVAAARKRFHLKPDTGKKSITSTPFTSSFGANATTSSAKSDLEESTARINEFEQLSMLMKPGIRACLEGLAKTSLRFVWRLWCSSLLLYIGFTWLTVEDRNRTITVPLSDKCTLATFTQMQREARKECISLELEDLTPVPDAMIQQHREQLELDLFDKCRAIEQAKQWQGVPFVSGILSGSFFGSLTLAMLRSSPTNQLTKLQNAKLALIKTLKSRLVLGTAILFNFLVNCNSENAKQTQYLLYPEHRAICFMEHDTFYRMIIQAYGAQGVAMVRYIRGTDNEELKQLVTEYLHFHEDYIEEEDDDDDSFPSLPILRIDLVSSELEEMQAENRKCFMESCCSLAEFMEDGSKRYGREKMANIKIDLNKRMIQRVQATQRSMKGMRGSAGPKEMTRLMRRLNEEKKKDPMFDYYSRLVQQMDMRHFYLDKLCAAFNDHFADKSRIFFCTRVFIWLLYPYAASHFWQEDNGHQWTRCICSSQTDLSWFQLLIMWIQAKSSDSANKKK